MNELKVTAIEDFKATTINEYDRKDIITKQGVDKAFLNKVNRNITYKRKLGQTNRRYNHEVIERLKQSYQNQESERIHDFSPDFEMSKFSLEDYHQILDNDIGDLMDSTPENNKKMLELQTMLKDLYNKRNIKKEPPKDLNDLLNLFQNLKKQGEIIVGEEKRKEAENLAKEVKVITVEDFDPDSEKAESKLLDID